VLSLPRRLMAVKEHVRISIPASRIAFITGHKSTAANPWAFSCVRLPL
jgi:hypothetical protein